MPQTVTPAGFETTRPQTLCVGQLQASDPSFVLAYWDPICPSVFGHGERLYATIQNVQHFWLRINVGEFVLKKDRQQGMTDSAWLFVPPRCNNGTCKVIILPGGCNAFLGLPPRGGSDDAFAHACRSTLCTRYRC